MNGAEYESPTRLIWFGRPVPESARPAPPELPSYNLLFGCQRSRPPAILASQPLLTGEQLGVIWVSGHLRSVNGADHSPPCAFNIAWRTATPRLPRPPGEPWRTLFNGATTYPLMRRDTLMLWTAPLTRGPVKVAITVSINLAQLMAEIVIVSIGSAHDLRHG